MTEFAEWLKQYGTMAGILLVILAASYRGTWVWGSALSALVTKNATDLADERARHAETKADRDRWQSIAFHALGLANSATNVLERRSGS